MERNQEGNVGKVDISRFSMQWITVDDLQLTAYRKVKFVIFRALKAESSAQEQVDAKGN